MSLYCDLRVDSGRDTISAGGFVAQRMLLAKQIVDGYNPYDPDEVHEYAITLTHGDGHREWFKISHRYGDEAWVLLYKALQKSTIGRPEL